MASVFELNQAVAERTANGNETFEDRLVVPPQQNGKIAKYPVEVRPSPGKGNGVFATRAIPRGATCCWYDGIITDDNLCAALVSGKQGYTQGVGFTGADEKIEIAGFPEVLREGGCAQLCNDWAMEYDEGDLKYLKHINVRCQPILNEDDGTICVAFIAKKRIAKGEELLYSYGQEFWECSRQREALGLHTDYAHKAIRIVLHQYSDLDAASKAMLVALYDEAADKQGWEGYRERFDIVRRAQLQQTPVLGARM